MHSSKTRRNWRPSAHTLRIVAACVLLALLVVVSIRAAHYFANRGTGQEDTTASAPRPSPDPSPATRASPAGTLAFPAHHDITATVFWVGEAADGDNDFIHNRSSAWIEDWEKAFGGVDSNEQRCGYNPCGFTPKENPFYFALPFNDYDAKGLARPASVLKQIPWYTAQPAANKSLLKNRWIKVSSGNTVAYAQWEDVGPFNEDDISYVFGKDRPRETRAGLDLSPAMATYLSVDGSAQVSWEFVDDQQVPDGPWKTIITTSDLKY